MMAPVQRWTAQPCVAVGTRSSKIPSWWQQQNSIAFEFASSTTAPDLGNRRRDLHRGVSILSRHLMLALALAAVALSAGPARPVRASPYALKALRDIALVGENIRELQAAVQPAAEQGFSSTDQLSSLSSVLESGTGRLVTSLDSLSAAVNTYEAATPPSPPATEADLDDAAALVGMASKPASLKSLTEQASKLHQLVDEERQVHRCRRMPLPRTARTPHARARVLTLLCGCVPSAAASSHPRGAGVGHGLPHARCLRRDRP